MSLFKNKWIIIKIDKDFQKDFIYHIFTYDYWIIKCNKKISKKEKSLDIWYLVNFEILTKSWINIHKIKNIKIIWEQNTLKDFKEINTFLELLSFVYIKIHSREPFFEVFNIIEFIILDNKINLDRIILANLKIIDLLWELDIAVSYTHLTLPTIYSV